MLSSVSSSWPSIDRTSPAHISIGLQHMPQGAKIPLLMARSRTICFRIRYCVSPDNQRASRLALIYPAEELVSTLHNRYGMIGTSAEGAIGGSTDFVRISRLFLGNSCLTPDSGKRHIRASIHSSKLRDSNQTGRRKPYHRIHTGRQD